MGLNWLSLAFGWTIWLVDAEDLALFGNFGGFGWGCGPIAETCPAAGWAPVPRYGFGGMGARFQRSIGLGEVKRWRDE